MSHPFWQTVTDWQQGAEIIRRRRYGVIETSAANLVALHFHPLPKLLAWPEVLPVGPTYHARGEADRRQGSSKDVKTGCTVCARGRSL